MELAHRPAAAVASSPEDSLKQALADFRAALPSAEQQELDESQNNGSFDDRNVMMLTSQIDAKTKSRFSRRLAPRLMPFLDCIDAFSGAIETFVSANPQTAALVWGSIKVFLMFACNFGEYFEKLTSILRMIGDTTPKFKEYTTLFHNSRGLQDALTNYYIGVVRLCRKAVYAFQRPGFIQAAKTALKPFEKEFEQELKDLEDKRRVFGEQVDLAKSRLHVEEAKFSEIERSYNDSFRRTITKFNSRAAQQLKDLHQWQLESRQRQLRVDRDKVLENLSDIDPSIAWRRIMRQCIHGTCNWIQKDQKFMDWIADDNSAVICNVGHLGRGKPVTFANVVEHLIFKEGSRSSIAYVFCQSEDSRTLVPRNIFGCLCRQLLQPIVKMAEGTKLEHLLSASGTIEIEDLLPMITKYLPLHTSYLLIDGLDELLPSDACILLRALKSFCEQLAPDTYTKVFVNFRPDRSNDVKSILSPRYTIEAPLASCEDDMVEFIKITLVEKIDNGQLLLDNADTILVIQHAVEQGAKGMFLWAKLFIEHLCQLEGDLAIFDALESAKVPTELAGIYDRIISRLDADPPRRENIRNTIMWATGAKRPLTAAEMQEAITIRRQQTALSPSARGGNIERIIGRCGGLLVLENDENTIHLVHSSLKEHLIQSTLDDSVSAKTVPKILFQHDAASLDTELFVLCATYLNFSDFNRSVTRRNPRNPNFSPIDMSRIATDSASNFARTAAKAMRLLNRPRQRASDEDRETYDRMFQRLRGLASSPAMSNEGLAFIEYAKYAWITHSEHLSASQDLQLQKLFISLVLSNGTHVVRPWENNDFARGFSSDLDPPSAPWSAFDFLRIPERNRALFLWIFQTGNPNHLRILKDVINVPDYSTGMPPGIVEPSAIAILNFFSRIEDTGPRKCQYEMKITFVKCLQDLCFHWLKQEIDTIRCYLVVLWDIPGFCTASYDQHALPMYRIHELIDLQEHLKSPFLRTRPQFRSITVDIAQLPNSWSNYPELECSPLSLAVICNRKEIFSESITAAKDVTWSIKKWKGLLKSLEFTVLWCREDMFHELFDYIAPLPPRYDWDDFSFKPALIQWAVEMGMARVAWRLLQSLEEQQAKPFSTEDLRALIWAVVILADIDVFAAVLKVIKNAGQQWVLGARVKYSPPWTLEPQMEIRRSLSTLETLISESILKKARDEYELLKVESALVKLKSTLKGRPFWTKPNMGTDMIIPVN